MAAEGDVIARVLRRRADHTDLLQILREIQEELGWISPETASGSRCRGSAFRRRASTECRPVLLVSL